MAPISPVTAPSSGASQAAWLDYDRAHVAQSRYPPPLVFERGEGPWLWDVAGNRFLDFESGQFCMSCGHSHPRATEALARQAGTLMQIGNRFTTTLRARLGERLARIAPDPLGMTFFCSTGSEANELAIRLAKLVTGRHDVVSLLRGYHGRTLASFTLSSASRGSHNGSGPLMTGAHIALPPYEHRCPFECSSCDLRCFELSTELIDRVSSGDPAAFVLEFVLGAGGIIPVPGNWARAVREWCTARGVVMIADEALTGIGRTGRWFAFEHADVVPDIIVVSKALGGGVPVAAVITTTTFAREAMRLGFVGAASHQGDPFQCAAALVNIDIIEEEGLLANAERQGELLGRLLESVAARHPRLVSDTRGLGLIRGVEISSDGAEAPDLAAEVAVGCMERGLLLGGLRPGIREGNTLRLAPPLTIREEEIREAVAILDAALADVSDRHELTGSTPLPRASVVSEAA